VFDKEFFAGAFAAKAREILDEDGGVAVEFVTLGGERIDALAVQSLDDDGMALLTRSERLVFLPYAQVGHVEMSGQRDHRIASFRLPESAP
jgi:hypothetical protein